MPTSSQALILQTSTSDLPPVFQKSTWNQAVPFRYMPFTNSQTRKAAITEYKQTLPGVFALRKTGSEPSLLRKYDFSTLTEILQIRRLGLSKTYNNKADFFNDMKMRPRELAPIRRNVYTDQPAHIVHRHATGRSLFIPDFRQSTEASIDHEFYRPEMYMRSKTDGDIATFEVTDKSSADYFRLFEVENKSFEIGDSEKSMFRTTFELEKTSGEEPGSFQIAPVGNQSLGHFRVIPPDGCEADVYRLQASDTNSERPTFQLLQRDPYEDNVFRTVETGFSDVKVKWDGNRIDHFKQGYHPSSTTKYDHLQNASGKHNIGKTRNENDNDTVRHSLQARSAENLAYNFEEVPSFMQNQGRTREDGSFQEMCDTGYILKRALHRPTDIETEGPDTAENMQEFRPPDKMDNDEAKKNGDLMGSIRNKSVDVYERLVNLGFRRANEDPEKVVFYENIRNRAERERMERQERLERQKYYGIDWKTDNVDQHSRPTENFGMTGSTFSSLDSTGLILRQMFPDQASFIEEIKPQLNNSKKKNRKIKAVRMRKKMPPKDPNAVCISLKDNAIPHWDLKKKIEQETGVKVISLQFDPISVHCPDPGVKSQWIVRFPNSVICEYLTKCGIDIGGVHYCVKSFDDVMQKEHNAFKLYTTIMDMKLRKTNEQKTKNVKQMNSSETQTLRLPQLKQITVL